MPRHQLGAIRRFACGGVAVAALGGAALASPLAASAATSQGGTLVYTLSNATAADGGNAVLAFRREGPALHNVGAFATGGEGTGVAPHSQGALALARGGSRLLAVNPGSNTVSYFGVRADGGLWLIDTVPSQGSQPVSVTVHGDTAYVLNAGTATVAANISGLHIGAGLLGLAGSTRGLSPAVAAAEQVGFTPDGNTLVVAEKGSDTIDSFAVRDDGRLGNRHSKTVATGTAPYGFSFDAHGNLVISDAAIGALSTWRFDGTGALDAINTVADTQAAPCWVVSDQAGRHAFTANAGSGTISSYDIAANGRLSLRSAAATTTGGTPLDEIIGQNGTRLFVLLAEGQIAMAAVRPSGDLGAAATVASGLPTSATGLVSVTTG